MPPNPDRESSLMNLQKPFQQWFASRAPQSYKTWNWSRKLSEIVRAYRASFGDDPFEVEPARLMHAARTIQDNLDRRHYVQDKTFADFDTRASNGIPKAIIGHFIKFLHVYKPTDNTHTVQNKTGGSPAEPVPPVDDVGTSATGFTYERDLKDALVYQAEKLFPEYKIYGDNEGIEYCVGGKRIDLLLQQKEGDGLLAIELKAGVADFKVFGQISMYRSLLTEQFPNRQIHCTIIAGEIDNSLTLAAKGSGVRLLSYRMELRLTEESH